MTDEADNKQQLIENRKEIADEAKKLADASDKKFLIDAGFIGGLGTAITTVFAQYGGSPLGSTILGASSASLITLSHITGTFNKDLYTKISEQAKNEAFDMQYGEIQEDMKPMLFEEYADTFSAQHQTRLSSLKTIRSVAIAGGFCAMAAFALTHQSENQARKNEEQEETINQGSTPAMIYQK